MSKQRILYCHCAFARVVPEAVKDNVLKQLAESGTTFEAVSDLCEVAAKRDPSLKRLAAGEGDLRIAACFPRAVKWLFSSAGAPLPEEAKVYNMRELDADSTVAGLFGRESPSEDSVGERESDGE